MDFQFENVEDFIVYVLKEYNTQITGDDFIGYKFTGDKKEFWNQILEEQQKEGVDLSFLNSDWFNEKGIEVLAYKNESWK